MSADNGIYIAKCGENDWRVAYAMSIDNVDYYPVGSPEWKKQVRYYFGEASSFEDKEEAWKFAYSLAEGYYYLEYGISELENDYSLAFEN